MTVAADSPAKPSRRRGAALEQAIYEAVFAQLKSVGYAELTMEGVAAAAGTGKAALYRRWPGREALVLDALSSTLPRPEQIPLGDDVRENILTVLRCLRDALETTYGAVFQQVKSSTSIGLHTMVRDRVSDPCREMILRSLQRGVAAGTLRPGADGVMTATVGPAMLVHRSLTEGPAVSDDFLVAVVDEVIMPAVRA
ncbi:TetR-like C-terminal domain-containing protein [Actinoplanes sp. N902-109]|uniref:TetR-like C-terminal domain-containing protein n=1 Tax=Actinoplanes sp. (strain N902-109) TaxID=649831 RepID=UPI00032952B5|nr:TetR-like C-terminal domain-containing protein [Actinoplanes sp. N902-109]AGL15946.1 TetR family transcriptional regulator [Actinoplanes sp. N902-109]